MIQTLPNNVSPTIDLVSGKDLCDLLCTVLPGPVEVTNDERRDDTGNGHESGLGDNWSVTVDGLQRTES